VRAQREQERRQAAQQAHAEEQKVSLFFYLSLFLSFSPALSSSLLTSSSLTPFKPPESPQALVLVT